MMSVTLEEAVPPVGMENGHKIAAYEFYLGNALVIIQHYLLLFQQNNLNL